MILRPRPGTSQDMADAKTALFSKLLEDCCFKTETKWGLEQMAHLGTGIWKWGIKYKKVITRKRTASLSKFAEGLPGSQVTTSVPTNDPPVITEDVKYVPRPFFESREISKVFVDPHTSRGDIRLSKYAIDVRYMDFYAFKELKEGIDQLPDGHLDKNGWNLPDISEIMKWWMPPTDAGQPAQLVSDNAAYIKGVIHHAEDMNVEVSPDLLFKPLEILEYWDANRKIIVLDRKKTIYSGDNPFGCLPFFSANWWNRPRAFYGMGLGLIVGQNQRVDQGTINAILKMLAFGVNPIYLRKRDSNSPTQMIRTGLGKILSVDGEIDKAYGLLETPKVPPDVWSALAESQRATESSSGADQTLVQGSSAGPRTSMGRTAGGAAQLGAASATRLDGPLDNFIEQVFKPFLTVLDMLAFMYISDAEIFSILGDELGKEYQIDLQEFHDAKIEYEVLAGASLAAKKTMSQSMTLITQIFENPNIQQNLAEINGEYVDYKPILKMWMEASEWKNFNDIIKPLTAEMKQKMQEKSQAAQQQSKAATQSQLQNQKTSDKATLQQQAADQRIQRDLVVSAFRNSSQSEDVSGQPDINGIQGSEPVVE